MSQLYKDAVFWIETDNIVPNPYQPRKEFDESTLEDLADSIRQYGILQPLTVTRVETMLPEGGMEVSYVLIAGERRLRASRIAGLHQVPVIIRKGDDDKTRFELAIIENLQREDLNPMDRAQAFGQLASEFLLTHAQIGKKMGKSREYVSNSVRLLALPEYIQDSVRARELSEGHTRPLLMLSDRPAEQETLYKEIMYKKMTVRESEKIARSIAKERQRKKEKPIDRTLSTLQRKFEETLGTRVLIEKNRGKGGKLVIDYFAQEDLDAILQAMKESSVRPSMTMEEGEAPDPRGATGAELEKIDALIAKPLESEKSKPATSDSESLPQVDVVKEHSNNKEPERDPVPAAPVVPPVQTEAALDPLPIVSDPEPVDQSQSDLRKDEIRPDREHPFRKVFQSPLRVPAVQPAQEAAKPASRDDLLLRDFTV
jgi:ParB family chromosome partitioning protein